MGVPKFYRWISERYPCLSEVVKEFQIPEFDNLYLDMNGIIHVCSHPEDNNPHFRITEEKIFKDIFHYLEFLFRIIKPRKVFFMAIDGVAPRAKMNQQRGRRFRSAREAEELERKAKESGEVLPTEKRFDSNCITPGTPFMVRLQEQLKYFVTSKISTDPLWSGVNVYLSGHETPGEGEHKIMDFIRHEKSQPNYDPNTRHCLYGLDADLMMLGLATHEPHFSLLREEVRFGGHKDKNKRPATPEETTFHLLHLSLFREYLNFEFCSLENKLPFGYDLENIIDDWVLMGFLVGNDFIPHLPHLHIQHDALPMLWKTYMTVLPECGGYLNEGGYLNLHRFEKYMDELRKFDVEKFNESYTDLKWLEGKLGDKAINAEAAKASQEINAKKRKKNSENQFAPLVNLEDDDDDIGDEFLPTASQAVALGTESVDMGTEDDSDTFDEEFRLHKCNYYKTKLEYEKVDKSVLKDQAEGYVKALQWILLYYYEGVPSWSWFYPHHYAPYISDVRDFRNMKIEFDLCTPFYPFQQLMAVLPAASKELLPKPYQSLMTQQESSIIDFYPVNFKTDLNGKQQDWEAVVLIPFIDEVRLLEAMTSVEHQLTPEEKGRNIHGPCLMYSHTSDLLDPYPSSLPEAFPDIQMNHARRTDIAIDGFRVESENLIKGLYPGVRLDVYFPGFPTLKHIQHKAYLKKEGVKVFQMNSRNDNMMLKIVDNTETAPDLEVIAKQILGKSIYVGWPHLFEAKVMSLSDDLSRYRLIEQTPMKGSKGKKNSPSQLLREDLNDSETSVWHGEVRSIKERYHDRLGIEVGDTFVLVKACPMVGRKYVCGSHGNITLDKQYAQNPVPYVYQATVQDIAVHDDSFCQYKTVSELFKKSDSVFMLGWPHYGSQGEVVDIEEADSIRIRINVSTPIEPNFSEFASDLQSFSVVYYPWYVAAEKVGTSSHFLSRITGSIFVKKGSPESHVDGQNVNIGLNLKFTKRNEEVPGYTKMSNDGWTYSQKTVEVVSHYIEKFPDVLQYISASESGRSDNFFESELFEGKSYTLKNVVDFLKTLECSQLKTMKCGAEILDSGVVQELEKEVAKTVELNKKKTKRVKMQVKPHLLFKPIVGQGGLVPDQSAEYRLFDRVVNIRDGYSVPFGLRGTVVGIHKAEKDIDTIYEIVFDDEFQGGIAVRCSPNRGYRASKSALINLSYGERKNGVGNSQPSNQASTSRQPYAQKQNFQNHSNNSSHNYHQNQSVGGYSEAIQRNHHDNRNRWEGWNMSNHHNQINNREEFHETKGGRYGQNGTNRSPRNYRLEQNHESDSRHGYLGDRKNVKDTPKNQKPNAPIMNMRQQSFDGSESTNPPTFVTPKVSPGKSMTRNSGVGAQSKIFHDAHNSEFANMWMELSGAGNVNSAKAPPSGNQKQSQQTPAMKDVSEIENHEVPKSKTDQSKSPRTLQDLFSQANKAKMAVSEQSEEKSEINNKDVKDSTLALKQMLKIGSDDDKVTSATETNENTSSNRQTYGRQVSVQELFEGAKQLPPSTNVAPNQLNIPPPSVPVQQYTLIDDQNQQIKQNQKHQRQQQQRQGQGRRGQGQSSQQMAGPHMYQQHGGQQMFINSQRNPVMELVHWCKSVGLLEPKYEFCGQLGSCHCIVSLSNGAKCKGSVTRTQEEAAESAAGAALLQMGAYPGPGMTPPLRMPGFGPPPPMYRQFSSPNSAFKPVSPISPGECPPHFNVPFPFPQHPPPPLQQPPPQRFVPPPPHQHVAGGRHQHQMNPAHMDNRQMYNQGNSYNRSAVRNYNSADSSDRQEERKRRDSETNSKNTPTFVPLQVTRQQKTPQKKRDSESEKEDDHYSKSKGDANTSVSTVSTSDVAKSISKGHNSATPQQNAASKTVRNNNVGDGKSEILANQDTTPPKHPPQPSQSKKRSRLAANLNFNAS